MPKFTIAMTVLAVSFWVVIPAEAEPVSANNKAVQSKPEIKIPQYKPGQVWAYKTRPQEPNSTLTIIKVDDDKTPSGKTIHIFIDGVNVKSPGAPDGYSHSIGHSPIYEKALAESTTKLLKQNVPLPSLDGYNEWKKAHDAGRAGAFTIPVSKIVEYIEITLNKAAPAPQSSAAPEADR